MELLTFVAEKSFNGHRGIDGMLNGHFLVLGRSAAEIRVADFNDLNEMLDWELAALSERQSEETPMHLVELFGDAFAVQFLRHKNKLLAETALCIATESGDAYTSDVAACRAAILDPGDELPEAVKRILLFEFESIFGPSKRLRKRSPTAQIISPRDSHP